MTRASREKKGTAAASAVANESPIVASTPASGPRTPLDAIRALRRIRDRLGEDDADAQWFAESLARYALFDVCGESLARAFGLVPSVGGDSWPALERRERCYAAIRELAKLGRTHSEIATKIRCRLRQRRSAFRPGASREDELLAVICQNDPPTSPDHIKRLIRPSG